MKNVTTKIEITRDTVCDGKNVYIGNVIETSNKEANTLTALGRAKKTDKAVTGAKASTPAKKPAAPPAAKPNVEEKVKAVKEAATLEALDELAKDEKREKVLEAISARRAELTDPDSGD